MPTAEGSVNSITGGTQFTSEFTINGMRYFLTGVIDPPAPEFKATHATLTYSNDAQLTTARAYDVHVSSGTLLIQAKDGLQITGHLDMPIGSPDPISGSGIWTTRSADAFPLASFVPASGHPQTIHDAGNNAQPTDQRAYNGPVRSGTLSMMAKDGVEITGPRDMANESPYQSSGWGGWIRSAAASFLPASLVPASAHRQTAHDAGNNAQPTSQFASSGPASSGTLSIAAKDGFETTGPRGMANGSPGSISGSGILTTSSAAAFLPASPDPASGHPQTTHDAAHKQAVALLTPDEQQLLRSTYPIIAIFGQSGTGKSTFINLISSDKQKISDDDDIHSCTDRIHIVEAKIHGKSVILIDSPGIDDTRAGLTESDVLAKIAQCLAALGKQERWVTGVLFLHCITDKKFRPSAQRISLMLEKLCGERAMNRLMICTTQWDDVSTTEGDKRHARLCGEPWKEMIAQGARTAKHSSRWDNAQTNAEAIVSTLIKDARPGSLAIQDEMLSHKKKVGETEAGKVLTEHLQAAQEKYDRELEEMKQRLHTHQMDAVYAARLREQMAASQLERAEIQRQQATLLEELDAYRTC